MISKENNRSSEQEKLATNMDYYRQFLANAKLIVEIVSELKANPHFSAIILNPNTREPVMIDANFLNILRGATFGLYMEIAFALDDNNQAIRGNVVVLQGTKNYNLAALLKEDIESIGNRKGQFSVGEILNFSNATPLSPAS